MLMAGRNQIAAQTEERLITEYPFREALSIYLRAWRHLGVTALTTVAGVCLVVLAVQVVSALSALGVAASVLTVALSFIASHPLLIGIFIVAVFVVILMARGAGRAKV
jgi:hypothetical protein